MNTTAWVILGYHIASRLAYVLYVGRALSAQERHGYFTERWGVEGGFRRFRRVAALVMNNDAVSFVVLCFASAHTLSLDLPGSWLLGTGAVLIVVGGATKLWAAATLGGRAYYWYNFFAVPASPPPPAGGPYRVLRNPMYTVGYLPTYGLALAVASLPGLIAAAFDHAAILAFYYTVEQPHFAELTRCRTEPYD
ncbi:MAG TPA: methyltransferase [Gemmatimonadales bacterium]|nr:methyltransferase [Gemmatimonadales bacterium]